MSEKFLNSERTSELWSAMKDYVGEHGGGTLLNSLNRQIAITQSQWTEVDGVYQCTVPCNGVIANEAVQNIYSTPAASQQSAYEEYGVKCVTQGTNTLTYQAKTLPSDLLMYVTIVNAGEITTNLVAWSPEMTSNTAPAPYNIVASGIRNNKSFAVYALFTSGGIAETNRIGFTSNAGFFYIYLGSAITTYGLEITTDTNASNLISVLNIKGSSNGANWVDINVENITSDSTKRKHTVLYEKPVSFSYYRFSGTGPLYLRINFLRPASDVGEVS